MITLKSRVWPIEPGTPPVPAPNGQAPSADFTCHSVIGTMQIGYVLLESVYYSHQRQLHNQSFFVCTRVNLC